MLDIYFYVITMNYYTNNINQNMHSMCSQYPTVVTSTSDILTVVLLVLAILSIFVVFAALLSFCCCFGSLGLYCTCKTIVSKKRAKRYLAQINPNVVTCPKIQSCVASVPNVVPMLNSDVSQPLVSVNKYDLNYTNDLLQQVKENQNHLLNIDESRIKKMEDALNQIKEKIMTEPVPNAVSKVEIETETETKLQPEPEPQPDSESPQSNSDITMEEEEKQEQESSEKDEHY